MIHLRGHLKKSKPTIVGARKQKTFFWLRLFSTIIDLSIISSFAIIIPAGISDYGFANQSVFFDALVYCLFFLFSILFLIIIWKPWWEMFSNTITVKLTTASRFPISKIFKGYTALVVVAAGILVALFIGHLESFFNQYRPVYPKTSETK